jgi:hypothetical protein
VEGGVVVAPPPPPHQSQTEVHVDGLGPRVVEGGPRRWDRDRIAALALVAFAVLTIVAMVMTLSLALAAITRGTRRSRGGGKGVDGVERLRGRHKHVRSKREFLQDQVIPNLVEGRERRVAHDDGTKMIVPLVQPQRTLRMRLRPEMVQPRLSRESVMLFIL